MTANVLVHLFDLERFTNYRGISPIRRGANDMRDGNDIKGFQKVLSKLSTALTLAIQGAPLEEDPWGKPPEPAGEESTTEEAPAESNEKQRAFTVADLVAGDIPTIPEGHELKQVNTPSAPANNIEVTSYLAGLFRGGPGPAAGLLPRRKADRSQPTGGQRQGAAEVRPAQAGCRAVGSVGLATGDRRRDRIWRPCRSIDGWQRCDFIGPSKITIDAGREMAQEREDVARGLMTRRDHYGNRGRSWRRETDQVFEEIDYILDRAKEIADEHGIPVETVMASFGLNASKAAQPNPNPNVPAIGEDANDAGSSGTND